MSLRSFGSALMLEELFDTGDDRLLAEVLASEAAGKLKTLAPRWYADARPAMRRMLLAYVDDGCDRPFHRPLVKALFKQAEAAGDDEAMGHFLAAFDRLTRHRLVKRHHYDWSSRTTTIETVLKSDLPRDVTERSPESRATKGRKDPMTGRRMSPAGSKRHFSRRTRRYLARRAFRYFRALGRRDAARYRKALFAALALYRDEHLERPEQLVDAWGLVHALFRGSPVLLRRPDGVRIAPGRTLADLAPAPLYPAAWTGCRDEVLHLAEAARSATVRKSVIKLLKREPGDLLGLPVGRLRSLLRSPHDELQELGAELLRGSTELPTLRVEEWLDLLSVKSFTAVTLVAGLVRAHLHPDRVTLDRSVDLALSHAAPVAELGIAWAREKPVASGADLASLVRLKDAPLEGARTAGATLLVERLRTSPFTTVEHVRDLLDSRYVDVRTAAWRLLGDGSPWAEDRSLWLALSETPYPDLRERLVASLAVRAEALGTERLQAVYATSLLAIHRGSRAKRTVLTRIASEVVAEPARSEELLPLLGLLLRSVRPAERKSALAAVTRAAFRDPAFRALLESRVPGLTFVGLEAA